MSNTKRVDKNLFSEDHYLGKPAEGDDKIIDRRIQLLNRYPDFFNNSMDCIEIGCGEGLTITKLANRFNKVLGIDIFDYSQGFKEQERQNNAGNSDFKILDVEKELPENTYDRLISFEVIEHLKKEDSVGAYFNILKNNGMAAITVPNKWWIFETHGASLPLLPWNRVPFFSWLPGRIHSRYANARIYTAKRIIDLLEKHHFKVIDHCYVTAPMDVLKDSWLKRQLTKYIFRNNSTSVPFLATSIFLLAKKDNE